MSEYRAMVIAVTDRKSCREDFLKRIERIYKAGVDKIILREKDLDEAEYERLAARCLEICGDRLYINSRTETAKKLGIKNIHLPMVNENDFSLPSMNGNFCSNLSFDTKVPVGMTEKIKDFESAGVSVHSLREAVFAEEAGADYIIAGHIFPTGCKPGLAPRGIDFIRETASAVSLPVFAIGGINKATVSRLKGCGIAGVCCMSELMRTENPKELTEFLKRALS